MSRGISNVIQMLNTAAEKPATQTLCSPSATCRHLNASEREPNCEFYFIFFFIILIRYIRSIILYFSLLFFTEVAPCCGQLVQGLPGRELRGGDRQQGTYTSSNSSVPLAPWSCHPHPPRAYLTPIVGEKYVFSCFSFKNIGVKRVLGTY